MAFYTGQKVVFVGGEFTAVKRAYPDITCPKKGEVYTIRELTCIGGKLGARFIEIVNPPKQYCDAYGECAWLQSELRPVCDKKTDISIFTKMLDKVDA